MSHISSPKHEEAGEGNWLVSYADMMTLLVGFFIILNSFSTIDDNKFEAARRAITLQFGGTYQIPYKDIVNHIRETLKKMGVGDQVVIKQSDSGVDISFLGTVFFDTGSAELKPQARKLLDQLIPVIKKESNNRFDITVEGHTDNVPIGPGLTFRNNWELSSLRACRVLDFFMNAGFPKSELTAVGYGDARPVLPNLDANGVAIPKNQGQNRRVVIRMVRKSQPMINAQDVTHH